MEMKVIKCRRTSLDFELDLTGHPDRLATATSPGHKELLRHPIYVYLIEHPDGRILFRTGDLGYADEDGYPVITGRVKNMMIRGGENLPVEAVEGALESHELVEAAAVVGLLDRRLRKC